MRPMLNGSGAAPDISLSAISEAVSSAEAQALIDALTNTWIFNSGFQRLLVASHDAFGLPWCDLASDAAVAASVVIQHFRV